MSEQKEAKGSGFISGQQWDAPKFLLQVGPWKVVSEHMIANGDDLEYMENMGEDYKDDSIGHTFPYTQADACWSFTEYLEPVGMAPVVICTGGIDHQMGWQQIFKFTQEESPYYGQCYIHWPDAAEEEFLVKRAEEKLPKSERRDEEEDK